jgi:hypothetical protein
MSRSKTTKVTHNRRAKGKTSPLRVSTMFSKILPSNYGSKSALISQYQHFFNSLESDAVFQMVKVVNVEDNCLTLSLPSAALVNYLRLHSDEISRQIQYQFGHAMALQISASPSGAQADMPHSKLKPAPHFSSEVSEKIKSSARDVDDDELMQSLMDLADAIRQKEP